MAAKLLDIPSTIVMPKDASPAKGAATQGYGAQTQHLGKITFPLIQRNVTNILTATDSELIEAMRFFSERMKLVVEPIGCLGFAAALARQHTLSGKRLGVILSGGNVDMASYGRLLAG